MIVGVDVGGTFTDFVIVDPRPGQPLHHKVPSTPDGPATPSIAGWTRSASLAGVERLSTERPWRTNTIIQRNGAVTGLIGTKGHRDMLEIRRGNKPEPMSSIYPLARARPTRAAPYCALDVHERLDCRGRVVLALDTGRARAAVDHLVRTRSRVGRDLLPLLLPRRPGTTRGGGSSCSERHPDLEVSTLVRHPAPVAGVRADGPRPSPTPTSSRRLTATSAA